ncbi:unnamed protein product, partial [marine sediment metagenome]
VGGITDFGVKVIEEANNLGIVVDVSHLNDPGFWDAMQFTKAPVVASHSNCRALQNHPRCLTDDQIKAVIDNGGVIGMNTASIFVDDENPDLERLLNHLDHIVELGGINNVGLGFDFFHYMLKYLDAESLAKLPSCSLLKGLEGDEEVPNVTEALILGMEGAEPLGNDIELLRIFYILGLRMLTLTHVRRNYVADGAHFFTQKEGKVGGITDFGVKVIEEANNLGIVVDVSHLNDPGFWDAMQFTKAP